MFGSIFYAKRILFNLWISESSLACLDQVFNNWILFFSVSWTLACSSTLFLLPLYELSYTSSSWTVFLPRTGGGISLLDLIPELDIIASLLLLHLFEKSLNDDETYFYWDGQFKNFTRSKIFHFTINIREFSEILFFSLFQPHDYPHIADVCP